MNLASAQALRGAPVWTRSGVEVGALEDLELDVDTGKLHHIQVRHGGWLKLVGVSHITVPWAQIIELTPQKVIIADAFVRELEVASSPLGSPIVPSSV